jgi:hypothetical protein
MKLAYLGKRPQTARRGPSASRVRSMKKLIVLAVLIGLGVFAAQKLRSS